MATHKVIINRGIAQIQLMWGATPFKVNPQSGIAVETEIAEAFAAHPDLQGLFEVHDFLPGEGPNEAINRVISNISSGLPTVKIETKPVVADTPDPNWNPLTCNYDEIETFIDKYKLVIDPDLDEAGVRQILDEHIQGLME